MLFVFVLLFVVVALFVSDKVRLDVVAVGAILALLLSGLLSPTEALSGFGDPVLLLIAGLFIVGEGLFKTGIAFAVGDWLMGVAGTNELKLTVMLMLVVAGLSAFMSSTGAVAIFIPIVLSLAAKADIAPSQLLMPISIAALLGGMLTLIGTPPNLIVSTQLEREGLEPFSFFSFAPIGLVILIVGIVYVVIAKKYLLPNQSSKGKTKRKKQTLKDMVVAYNLEGEMLRLKLDNASGIVNQTIEEAKLLSRYNTMVIGIERNNLLIPVRSSTKLKSGDFLLVAGAELALSSLYTNEKLEKISIADYQVKRIKKELGLAEVMMTPKSTLISNSLIDLNFRQHHNLTVLGVKRMGKLLEEDFSNVALEFGDTLLVAGAWKDIALLQEVSDDFLILDLPKELEEVSPNREKAPYALGILGIMLLLMTFNLVPSVTAVLLAALAMVITGALSMNDAYRSLNAQSLVLIAGMLPMAIALDKTGGVLFIANALVEGLGDYGPFALMAGLFILTSIFSQFISNTATTVLVAPIAVAAASALDVSVYPILMTVAIAASTAFATPVASPVNTLVLGPGGYKFIDYVKMGVPLQVIVMIITLLAVPVLFPL
ncbi:MAG: hypothetical protein DRQ78_05085 [Epsilonproteobacteria bacterium]|nr:MAG: hypothetical protein DRQ78_05085 [Campylobacterota bacterium]